MAAALLRTSIPTRKHGTALIVEDSPTDAAVLASYLSQLGYQAVVAQDGAAGVRAAIEGDYDFILMDIEMPTLDGLDATRAIHELMGPRSPFIVAITSHTSLGDRLKCQQAGMDYFMAKPVRLAAIAKLVAG